MTDPTSTSRADAWRARGAHFSWKPAGEDATPVQISHVELGDPGAPVLALVHGFPTCSIDWFDLGILLSDRYHVCAIDFPGYGFSDKPVGWGYSLTRDAELLGHYLTEVLETENAVVFAHDRGDSVSLILAGDPPDVRLERLFLTNGNMFLPLANLTVRDGNRLALANIKERLDLMYGERATVKAGRFDEEYIVTLRFPFSESAVAAS